MNKKTHKHWLIGLIVLFALWTTPNVVYSQQRTTTSQIDLTVGSVFEIIADTDISNPDYSWVLNQGNTFQQAGREPSFRTRLTKKGRYTLTGTIANADKSISHRKVIYIDVRTRSDNDTIANPGAQTIIAGTHPKRDQQNRILFQPGNDVIRIDPNPNTTSTIILDLDSENDLNRNGRPNDDQQAAGTFFSTKSTPLHIWFTVPIEKRILSASLQGSGNTETITLITASLAQQEDQEAEKRERENPEILISQFGKGQVGLGLDQAAMGNGSAPLLMHWKFGDGKQSLLDRPIHRYAENGEYDVSVTVRNLNTGEVVAEYVSIARVDIAQAEEDMQQPTEDIPVENPQSSSSAASSTSSVQSVTSSAQSSVASQPDTPSDSESEGRSLLGTILLLILVGVLSIGCGFVVILILKFLKKKSSLQGALSRMEDTLMSNNQKSGDDLVLPTDDVTVEPPPLSLPDDTESPGFSAEFPAADTSIVDAEVSSEPAASVPSDDATTPSWLSQGMEEAQASGQTADSPPPTSLQEDTSETPSASDAAPVATPEPSTADTPAWLQPSNEPTQTPEPAPDAVPTADTATPAWLQPPGESTAPATSATPTEPAAPAPDTNTAQADSSTPAWLQPPTATEPNNEAGATNNAPASPPPADPAPAPTVETDTSQPSNDQGEDLPPWLQPQTDAADANTGEGKQVQEQEQGQGHGLGLGLGKTNNEVPQEETEPRPGPSPRPENSSTEPVSEAPGDVVPDWLQPNASSLESSASESAPDATQQKSPETSVQQSSEGDDATAQDNNAAQQQDDGSQGGQQTTQGDDASAAQNGDANGNDNENGNGNGPTKDWSEMTKEEREREKKRQKRKRYRENKKKRQNGQSPGQGQGNDTGLGQGLGKTDVNASEENTNAPLTDTAPDWLANGMQKAEEEGQTQDSPPPAELQDAPPPLPVPDVTEPQTAEPQESAPVPDWLQPNQPAAPTPDTPADQQSAEPASNDASDDNVEFIIRADSLEEEKKEEDSNNSAVKN